MPPAAPQPRSSVPGTLPLPWAGLRLRPLAAPPAIPLPRPASAPPAARTGLGLPVPRAASVPPVGAPHGGAAAALPLLPLPTPAVGAKRSADAALGEPLLPLPGAAPTPALGHPLLPLPPGLAAAAASAAASAQAPPASAAALSPAQPPPQSAPLPLFHASPLAAVAAAAAAAAAADSGYSSSDEEGGGGGGAVSSHANFWASADPFSPAAGEGGSHAHKKSRLVWTQELHNRWGMNRAGVPLREACTSDAAQTVAWRAGHLGAARHSCLAAWRDCCALCRMREMCRPALALPQQHARLHPCACVSPALQVYQRPQPPGGL